MSRGKKPGGRPARETGTQDTESRGAVPGLLTLAIERKEWEVAALCLLLGFSRALRSLPPDAAEALLEMLSAVPEDPRTRRRGGCRERRR